MLILIKLSSVLKIRIKYWNLYWNTGCDNIEITDKWYERKPETVMHNENNSITITWDMPINTDRSFSLSRDKHGTKTYIGNRRVEEAKKMKFYKRLIYKQFVQISGPFGPQFLSYLPRRFTHLCRALYGDTILVYSFSARKNEIYRKSTKTSGVHIFYKSSFSSLES